MSVHRHFVLAAGGTGGHMVPAAALAAELEKRGHRVSLISDARGVRFPGLFEGIETHILPAGRFAGGLVGWAVDLARVPGFPGFPAFLASLVGSFHRLIHTCAC